LTLSFIDTHAHLYLSEFRHDRDSIIENAIHRGVDRILLPNIDSRSIGPMNELAGKYPGVCFPMMGLHPTSVKDNYDEELDRVRQEMDDGHYCAVGEIGIDLYWDKHHQREQCKAFAAQIDLALKHNFPIVIHARESFSEILEILEGYRNKGLRGVFHAFTGTLEIAHNVIDMGFMLGIGGIVTYKNSALPDVIRAVDLSCLVLETDSPYLAPVPMRGKRNESSYIPYIAEAVRNIKNVSLEEVANATTSNAINLFQLNEHA
jgi:TatD DNase family protein